MAMFSKNRKKLKVSKTTTETSEFVDVDMENVEMNPRPTSEQDDGKLSATASIDLSSDLDVVELDSIEPVSDDGADPSLPAPSDANGARAFAIGDAIRLLQSLPASPRVDSVVRVVRVTLGSADVGVGELRQEITRRERAIEGKMALIQAQADALEKNLQAKRAELATQQAELNQLTSVRGRLLLATQPASHRPPPIPRDALKGAKFGKFGPTTTAAVE